MTATLPRGAAQAVMNALALVPPATRLDELRAVIAGEHQQTVLFAAQALQHAIRCGSALIEAKDLLPHGEWTDWRNANVAMSASSTVMYMRIAAHADLLHEHEINSISGASAFLTANGLRLQISQRQREQMRALSAAGVPQAKIAEEVDCSQASVARHLQDPELGSRPKSTENFAQRWAGRHRPVGMGGIVGLIKACGEAQRAGDVLALACTLDQLAQAAMVYSRRLREGTARP